MSNARNTFNLKELAAALRADGHHDRTCETCGRTFDLTVSAEANAWHRGECRNRP